MSTEAKNYNSGNSDGGSATVNIGTRARDITFYVRGGRGGVGGADASDNGGNPGSGQYSYFTVKSAYWYTNFSNCTVYMGGRGGNGTNNQGGAPGGGGGPAGISSGGPGGNARPAPYSGGGGGGGGASGVTSPGGTLIVIGGSGGGGGASLNRPGGGGGAAGGPSGVGGYVSSNSNGGQGGSSGGGDGGGGGGGGAGAGGGNGGGVGEDKRTTAGGGGGGGSQYNSTILDKGASGAINENYGQVVVSWTVVTPELRQFYATPNPAVSTNTTTLNWDVADSTFTTLTLPTGQTVDVTGLTSYTYNSLPSSNVESNNSPATASFTLRTGISSYVLASTLNVDSRTDGAISGTGTWNTSWSGLEPNTTYDREVGEISGIDINITVTSPNNVFFSKNGLAWSASLTVSNGDTLYVRFTSPPFNTSLDDISPSATFGNTNSETFQVNIGSNYTANWTMTTRAPRIKQSFDFIGGTGNSYPNPDIDFDPGDPSTHLLTNSITFNDIEIDVPIKSNNENIQVKINSLDWQDVQEIT